MNVYDQTFILAKLTSGSFKKTKHPDRLLVFAEPPRPRGPAKLRIGYPSSKRVTAFFACDSLGIDLPRAGFGAVQSSDHLYQLTRNTDIPDTSSWPDTLIVRFFDDPADEEIALERNEIDAAMFWPGEPSTHIRDKLRWSGEPSGLRQRGIVAGLFMSYHPTIDSVTTAVATRWVATALNNELFRGDLAPCGTSVVDTTATVRDLPIRFDVDPAFPNHDDLQILLHLESQQAGESHRSRAHHISGHAARFAHYTAQHLWDRREAGQDFRRAMSFPNQVPDPVFASRAKCGGSLGPR
jgi:hypothetical protein